jgi:hypothetical protein
MRCAGAPRDLGLDQGRAAAAAVRRAAGLAAAGRGRRLLAALRPPEPGEAALQRDLLRHFPHLGERAFGLSRGAGLGLGAIVRLLLPAAQGEGGVAVAAAPERTGGGALLVRALPLERAGEVPLWVRHGAPDNDFASVEAVVPWRVAACAGVNEHGLAATALTLPAPRHSFAGCAAPAALLVQECLQRFRSLEAAVEWCERRPAGGRVEILLADRSGGVAGVRADGAERRALRPTGGLLLAAPEAPASQALRKACGEEPRLSAARLGDLACEAAGTRSVAVIVDADGGRVAICRPGDDPHWHAVAAPPR